MSTKYRKTYLRAAPLCFVAAVFLTGCQTAKSDDPPAEESSEVQADTQQEREQMQVEVQGASATQEGNTITVDYPVIEDKNDRIPDWAINPSIGGVVGAVGVATQKGLGAREQLDEARLSGRLELASMLETRVQTIGRSALEENLMATSEGRSENSRRSTLGVDRDILDIVLAGSRQRALWFDPMSGECYVWMVMDGGVLSQSEHYVVDDISVFIANTPIETEYKPVRRKAPKPVVIVEAQEQAPPPPKEPVEELEESLKPIETVPIHSEDKK